MRRFSAAVLALTLALAACGGGELADEPAPTTTVAPTTTSGEMDAPDSADAAYQRNLELWRDQGPSDYRLVYERSCFCLQGTVGVHTVMVRDGQVVEASLEGRQLDPAADHVYTVEELFQVVVARYLEDGLPADGEYVGVQYHPELGYPVSVEGRWESPEGPIEMADEEEITVLEVEPLQ